MRIRDLDGSESCNGIIMFQSVEAKKNVCCDFMRRHLNIFRGVKSFSHFAYLCFQIHQPNKVRHHFSFLGAYCEKS